MILTCKCGQVVHLRVIDIEKFYKEGKDKLFICYGCHQKNMAENRGLISEILPHLYATLEELKGLNEEEVFDTYESDVSVIKSLIEKLPISIELTKEEAFGLTQFLPGNYEKIDLVIERFVIPYLAEQELADRIALADGEMSLLDRFEESMGMCEKKDKPIH